jgi:hypothetical protein
MCDDGAVVYLNGTEVLRHGMPSARKLSTRSTGHEAGNAYEKHDTSWAT